MIKRKLSLRWFGSLSNLSGRRSSSPADLQAAPAPDGSKPAPDGSRCGKKPAAAGDQSVDDMEACLHSPGYARSSDMYTHVGTVPRSDRQKKSFKCLKEKMKRKKEEEEGGGASGGQGQCKAGEHVPDSLLLSALSSLTLDRPLPVPAATRPLPATPTPSRASPLTSGPDGFRELDKSRAKNKEASEPSRPVTHPSNMATNGPKVSPAQDVYVPMDPITEAARDHQREKQQRDSAPEPRSPPGGGPQDGRPGHVTDGSGEYVKFSKGKFWLEPASETQRKQLEEELKLSGTKLKSNAWYHGHIPWEVSESLVGKHGDFLIRDSQSSQGDFVLTSHWEEKTLHFLIRKTSVQAGETHARVQFSLGGGAFDTLQALVHFHVGSRAALTPWSSAQIHQPVHRTLPLSYLETAFCTVTRLRSDHGGPGGGVTGGEDRVRPRSPSSLVHKGADMSRGQDGQTLSTSGESTLTSPNIHTPRCRSPCYPPTTLVAPSPSFSRSLNSTQAASSPNSTLTRQRNHRYHQTPDPPSPDADGRCYTELYPGPQSYVERLWAEDGTLGVDPLRLQDGNVHFSPVVETVSSFKPSRYTSPLMPEQNKPLEVGILRRVKELLAEIDPRTAAQHITRADCTVARILPVTPEVQRMMGVSSGIELLTLPHGQQLRLDLLERFHTMAIMLAVDVLGCTGTNEERAGLLYKIIQIAAELKSTMGNMFGFAAVMRALELPQVSRLEQMWTALRQRHTEGAILYEKTLKPFMKSLNDGRESCPLSNTTFPHVLPLLSLLEKSVAMGEGAEPWETAEVGMDVVMFHLGAARTIAQLGGIYQSNAQSKLQGSQEQAEVLELFLTDFQLRLLWGSRGAPESQALRYTKFDQVLTALSNKLEPPLRSH